MDLGSKTENYEERRDQLSPQCLIPALLSFIYINYLYSAFRGAFTLSLKVAYNNTHYYSINTSNKTGPVTRIRIN